MSRRTARRLPVIWHPAYEVDIGPHIFPTRKYRAIVERLLEEATIAPGDIHEPRPATDDQVRSVHDHGYVEKILGGNLSWQDQAILEVPFSHELREAMWLCAGGSVLAGRLALSEGIAVHIGGGFHHAFAGHGEGFCLINDVAIALRALLKEGSVARAVVIDCDVHQGNGTAAIFAEEPAVFTFSMHQQHNYPLEKPPSDLDIGLPDGVEDEEYLRLLEEGLGKVLSAHRPDLAYYLAGADPYRRDQLGGLHLSMDGLRRRDEMVFEALGLDGVATAVTLAGGYALRPADTVAIHCETVRVARRALDSGEW